MVNGHTNCNLPAAIMNDYYSNTKVFHAMVMYNKTFIYCCNHDRRIAEWELLSINNHPMDKIILRLFNYIQLDAFIHQSHKNWELPECFHLPYNVLYGETNSYNISYKTKSGEIKKAKVQADTIKNIFCPPPFPRPNTPIEAIIKLIIAGTTFVWRFDKG